MTVFFKTVGILICWFAYQDLNACKILLTLVGTLSRDTVDSHHYQQLTCKQLSISDGEFSQRLPDA